MIRVILCVFLMLHVPHLPLPRVSMLFDSLSAHADYFAHEAAFQAYINHAKLS